MTGRAVSNDFGNRALQAGGALRAQASLEGALAGKTADRTKLGIASKGRNPMNAHNLKKLTIALGLIILTANSALATEGVSPGAVDRMAQVNNACPTFSWEERPDAVVLRDRRLRPPRERRSGDRGAHRRERGAVLPGPGRRDELDPVGRPVLRARRALRVVRAGGERARRRRGRRRE